MEWFPSGRLKERGLYKSGQLFELLPLEAKESPKRIKVQEPKKKGGVKL